MVIVGTSQRFSASQQWFGSSNLSVQYRFMPVLTKNTFDVMQKIVQAGNITTCSIKKARN